MRVSWDDLTMFKGERAINAPIRKSELTIIEGTEKGRGRPKLTLV